MSLRRGSWADPPSVTEIAQPISHNGRRRIRQATRRRGSRSQRRECDDVAYAVIVILCPLALSEDANPAFSTDFM